MTQMTSARNEREVLPTMADVESPEAAIGGPSGGRAKHRATKVVCTTLAAGVALTLAGCASTSNSVSSDSVERNAAPASSSMAASFSDYGAMGPNGNDALTKVDLPASLAKTRLECTLSANAKGMEREATGGFSARITAQHRKMVQFRDRVAAAKAEVKRRFDAEPRNGGPGSPGFEDRYALYQAAQEGLRRAQAELAAQEAYYAALLKGEETLRVANRTEWSATLDELRKPVPVKPEFQAPLSGGYPRWPEYTVGKYTDKPVALNFRFADAGLRVGSQQLPVKVKAANDGGFGLCQPSSNAVTPAANPLRFGLQLDGPSNTTASDSASENALPSEQVWYLSHPAVASEKAARVVTTADSTGIRGKCEGGTSYALVACQVTKVTAGPAANAPAMVGAQVWTLPFDLRFKNLSPMNVAAGIKTMDGLGAVTPVGKENSGEVMPDLTGRQVEYTPGAIDPPEVSSATSASEEDAAVLGYQFLRRMDVAPAELAVPANANRAVLATSSAAKESKPYVATFQLRVSDHSKLASTCASDAAKLDALCGIMDVKVERVATAQGAPAVKITCKPAGTILTDNEVGCFGATTTTNSATNQSLGSDGRIALDISLGDRRTMDEKRFYQSGAVIPL